MKRKDSCIEQPAIVLGIVCGNEFNMEESEGGERSKIIKKSI